MKKKPSGVLNSKERQRLAVAIANAPRKTITVKEHERLYYRLQKDRDRRLARWADVEVALFRLSSDIDRAGSGVLKDEMRRIKDTIQLLDDLAARL